MKKFVVSLIVLAAAACSPPAANDAGADAAAEAAADGASQSKPTCVAIAERCHEYDGVNAVATMCHRAVEAPTATEAQCMGLLAQCNDACPEGDGGHSHGDAAASDAAADADHSHEDAAADSADGHSH